MSTSNSYYCYLPMPFRKGVRISLQNRSHEAGGQFFCEIGYSKNVMADNGGGVVGYFAAKYNTAWPIVEETDYVLFDYKGRGAVVGQVMTVEPVKADRKRWWEGDRVPGRMEHILAHKPLLTPPLRPAQNRKPHRRIRTGKRLHNSIPFLARKNTLQKIYKNLNRTRKQKRHPRKLLLTRILLLHPECCELIENASPDSQQACERKDACKTVIARSKVEASGWQPQAQRAQAWL
jgi:hypothetical protein